MILLFNKILQLVKVKYLSKNINKNWLKIWFEFSLSFLSWLNCFDHDGFGLPWSDVNQKII